MTWIERRAQIAVAILFALALTVIGLFALNSGASATQEPFACKIVSDADAMFSHAVAEARFHSLPAWENRHKAFRGDISGGVAVSLSQFGDDPGYVRTSEETISTEREYRRVRVLRNARYFKESAAKTLLLPTGSEIAIEGEYARHHIAANAGARVRYWYYNDLEPERHNFFCYEIRGRGHPPTPTPTPEPEGGA